MTAARVTPSSSLKTERGFTLVEVLVALAITTVVMGSAMLALSQATRAAETAKLMTNVNGGLRTAMDLIVRDMLQTGQGLPSGRVIQVPAGLNSQPIRLPGPPNTSYQVGGVTELTAIIPGPGLGPAVNGQPTDMITTLQADGAFDQVRLVALPANGLGMNVDPSVDLDDGTADDLHPGDLIMLTKGSLSALAQVTRVNGQHVSFEPGDSLNLNQPNAEMGTVKWIRNAPPTTNPPGQFISTTATRIRMISYYIDATTDPQRPRLVRRINNGHETAFDNSLGTTVAFNVENLQITYDLANGVSNPANVRMVAADLNGSGACSPDPCSPNQIRKLNVMLRARSSARLTATQQFFRNELTTQVSLRSMAFVDRYR
ncbi:MAG TPA: type II secretion system protein [Vicinamibacterales bacterium]